MNYADACSQASTVARNFQIPVAVVRHPVTDEHSTATIGELASHKQWADNPDGFPNAHHIVAIASNLDGSITPCSVPAAFAR